MPATAAAASVSSSAALSAAGPVIGGGVKTTLVGFNAGNIMSDAVFTNKNSMSEAQIQAFFNGKVARCASGYTCLKDFRTTSVTRPADKYCAGYTGAANESAARIIYRAAQSCNINPQVLIVMLQKEQSLVTYTAPTPGRFNIALGQGCPDDAPCDPQYVGFFHQIYGAARQMQIYMEGKWFQYYAPGKTWNIRYDVELSCGSSPVYIANKATSALYYYTPYQPNAAALRAGWGEGDGCSAHGNRNFYNYFTEWFGSTQIPSSMIPSLSSTDLSPFVLGADKAGEVWGYPYLNGAWGDRVKIGTGLTGVKKFFGVGDLDGDGHRDFVAVKTSGAAQLMRGNGTTTLSAPTNLTGDWSGVVLAAPAGDFDGNGVPDLFTTDAAGRLLLWSGNDRGGFAAPRVVGNGWSMMNLLTGNGDFDGDGRADLIARDTAGRLYLYSGNGKGTWKGSKQIGNGWQGFADVFNTGDFTGDGHPDLLATEPGGTLRLYRGSAGGWLTDGMAIGSGWHTFASAAGAGPLVVTPRALPAGAGNLDGVYGRDLVALTDAGELRVYGTTGDGNWGGILRPQGGWAATDRVIPMGDFNGDGFSDLGQVDAAGAFWLHPGVSGGGFGPRVNIGSGWNNFLRIVGGLDFDGNRVADVLAVDPRGNLLLYRGSGGGGWATGSGVTIGQGWAGFTDMFSVGDFDGDGLADLMGRTSAGLLMLYPTTGDGNWGNIRSIGQGWGGMAKVFSTGDFNGDGNVDVLGVLPNGDMYLYRGNGRGSWTGDQPRINAGWQIMKQLV
ncbi:FG-GAP repeat domain-containing protein [Microbacterium sp. 179-I 3D2 NHS]|uniref:FG-GAP repeat domain-containing protein n=1 Tax=Microbacterium sp. 179-I 3D2 NHS TaxID=3235178 RepID=UPI00399F3112